MSGDRLLVRLPNWVGDGALAAPALRALHQARPNLRLLLVGTAQSASLFGRWPCEALFSIERRKLSDAWRILRTTRSIRIDEALVLAPSFRAALMPVLMRIPRRVGFVGDGRRILLTEPVRAEGRTRHLASQFLSLAARLGADPDSPLDPALPIGEDEKHKAREYLDSLEADGAPLVALCPGATYGETKRWPLEHWVTLASSLIDDGAYLFVLGGQDETAIGEAIVEARGRRIQNLAGRLSLRQSLALLASLDGAVSNDSGAMHLAAAACCPVIGLFGSTNPDWTGPLGRRSKVLSLALPCSPCYARKCPTKIECLRDLPVRLVHEEVRGAIIGVGKERA